MSGEISGIGSLNPGNPRQTPGGRQDAGPAQPGRAAGAAPRDRVDIGRNGPLTPEQAAGIVTERSMEQLRQVVNEARDALGLDDDAPGDTSPGAAAGRIMEFALGFFERFREEGGGRELEEAEARQAFADLIGPAIEEGIGEARDILTALNAMNAGVTRFIDGVSKEIGVRLDEFVENGTR